MNKKFDPTLPVQTRDGREARIICKDAVGAYPIVYLALANSGKWEKIGRVTAQGWQDCDKRSEELDGDLINIPEEHEVMMYLFNSVRIGEKYIRDTNVSAEAIASKRITFTEGEFEE